jgi:hypothetical protein
MRLLTRLVQRIVIFGLGVVSVWLIVFVVFEDADRRLPLILAVSVTYALAAYVILPWIVRIGLKVLHRRLIPSYTVTGDGLPGDPVNIVLIGTIEQLRSAFAKAGWSTADRLDIASSLKMARAFLLNRPYPTAPFSTLYLFGRAQDIGFQEPIGDSPRKRHHVRFWARGLASEADDLGSASFWLKSGPPPLDTNLLWIGAGTRDTGISLTRLTFQITHATDSDTNAERGFIVSDLVSKGVIADVEVHKAGSTVQLAHVNHYVTDGDIVFARLVGQS